LTDYVVMFPADNEAAWEARTEADRQATFDTDFEFGKLLAARGGAVKAVPERACHADVGQPWRRRISAFTAGTTSCRSPITA
jgi:hypothetical protein